MSRDNLIQIAVQVILDAMVDDVEMVVTNPEALAADIVDRLNEVWDDADPREPLKGRK